MKPNEKSRTSTSEKEEIVLLKSQENICVFCGAIIPEGVFVCPKCENYSAFSRCSICKRLIAQGDAICRHCVATLLQSKENQPPSPKPADGMSVGGLFLQEDKND